MAASTAAVAITSTAWQQLVDGSVNTSGVIQVMGTSPVAIFTGTASPGANLPSSTFHDYLVYDQTKDYAFAGLNSGEGVWACSLRDASVELRVTKG